MDQGNNQTGSLTLAILVIGVACILWPLASGGCTQGRNGLEIASWLGKVKVKPLPPEPVLKPPVTRCLIFGYSGCPGCREQHRSIQRDLVPLGWRVGPAPTDDIEEIDIHGRDERINKYKHSSYPTLIIVDQQGVELDRKTGPIPSNELLRWIHTSRGLRCFDD